MPNKGSIKFNRAAFKHGVTEADILCAFQTYIFEDPVEGDDNKFLLIDFDTKANPVEVVYNRIDTDRINVFHAMPLRPEYEALLEH
ncbi:hypothetical protein [Treponema endosymbiont of Eucomonympha sp.]|uniref:hypothetical protein n=1 Tax=Treponema endosymbiont of Eucomonympha sp. TaxID=1580831 RepID=UPI0007518ECE|nr:hypothetical protein [Treponema endosymbiont of Eucomonympha sp.]